MCAPSDALMGAGEKLMEYDRSEVRVGLVLVVGIVLLVTFFAVINRWTVGEQWRVTTKFSDVMGVDREAIVQYAGRRAGKVEDLQYVQEPEHEGGQPVTRVQLVLAVDGSVPLTDKDLVYIDRSLTGEVVVQIEPHPGTRCTFGKPVVLPSKEVPTFASLMERVDQTITVLGSFAKDERPVVEDALTSFRDTFTQAKEMLAENSDSLHRTVADAGDLFAQLQPLVKDLGPKVKSSVEDFQDVIGRLQALLKETARRSATPSATSDG